MIGRSHVWVRQGNKEFQQNHRIESGGRYSKVALRNDANHSGERKEADRMPGPPVLMEPDQDEEERGGGGEAGERSA